MKWQKWARFAPYVITVGFLPSAIYYGVLVAGGETGPNGGHVFALVVNLLLAVVGVVTIIEQEVNRRKQKRKLTAASSESLPARDATSPS